MTEAAKRGSAVHYPETDDMAEPEAQHRITVALCPLLVRWLASQQRVARVGGNQFVYWVEGDPSRTRAPDVYVIDGIAQDGPAVGAWKTWLSPAPRFVLEVCSTDIHKDYVDAVADYQAMGVEELVIFDPNATPRSRIRRRWQVYRRDGQTLRRVATSWPDRVQCASLGCWLREVTQGNVLLLRVATGPRGDDLLPTAEEQAEAAQAQAKTAQAQAEAARRGEGAARAEAEAAKVARAEAEAEIARLRALLAAQRGGS